MMVIRTTIVGGAGQVLMQGLLTGLRYSTVRRQFKNISGRKEETQLIDYQTQQFKLFPLLATAFADTASF